MRSSLLTEVRKKGQSKNGVAWTELRKSQIQSPNFDCGIFNFGIKAQNEYLKSQRTQLPTEYLSLKFAIKKFFCKVAQGKIMCCGS